MTDTEDIGKNLEFLIANAPFKGDQHPEYEAITKSHQLLETRKVSFHITVGGENVVKYNYRIIPN